MFARAFACFCLLATAAPAAAQLADPVQAVIDATSSLDIGPVETIPGPVQRMIDAALETGNRDKVAAVIEMAKATNPKDAEEIDGIHQAFQREQRELAAARRAAELEEIRQAGLFERWKGRGQIGGFQSTGNSDNIGITATLNLERVGIDWRHKMRLTVDYQESNSRVTREQYFASYEPRYQVTSDLFAYALAQYEKDRFQGVASRYAVSGGLGYQVMKGQPMQLSLQAGPAWRHTKFTNGLTDSSIAALVALDFDWQLTDSLKFTQNTDLVANGGGSATAIIDGKNTSLNLVTGFEADIVDWLTARLSYTVEYDSDPPVGAVKTDTLTRFTLIYGF